MLVSPLKLLGGGGGGGGLPLVLSDLGCIQNGKALS